MSWSSTTRWPAPRSSSPNRGPTPRTDMLTAASPALLFGAFLGGSLYWPLPLVIILISLVYSATRYDQWNLILREAFRWGVRLTGFLFAVIFVLFLVATMV